MNVRPSDAFLVLLTAATLTFFGLWQVGKLEAAHDRSELALMRAEQLVERIDSAGWELRIVEATDGLEEQLRTSHDSTATLFREKAELAADVEALGGEMRALVDVNARLSGRLETLATVHVSAGVTQDSARNITEIITDSITAPLDDGLLTGRVAYFPTPQTFDLEYSVALALTLGIIDMPDGRQLVNAMSADPRVGLSFGDVYIQPPAPVAFCSIGQRLEAAAYGGAAAAILRLAFGGSQ